jgi:hypothetical protein
MIKFFYFIKPFLPRRTQLFLRKKIILYKRQFYKNVWPIDEMASKKPYVWKEWPENKKFSLVLTHDVDTARGQEKCKKIIEIEEELGFLSSFNFVPERYNVSSKLRHYIVERGFEVGVHGLFHDGKLYKSRKIFKKRANRINQYIKDWGAVGFRSPAMHHNLEWIHDLNILYDASTFDIDPFEPQSDGLRTIFPSLVTKDFTDKVYVELPYTLPQDFTLFILMKELNVNIWKKKLDWIAEKGGMALLNVHPDYMKFDDGKLGTEEYPAEYYKEFLKYIQTKHDGQYWHVLPKDMARFWKSKFSNTKKR